MHLLNLAARKRKLEELHLKYFSRAANSYKVKCDKEVVKLEKEKLQLEVNVLKLKEKKLRLEIQQLKKDAR